MSAESLQEHNYLILPMAVVLSLASAVFMAGMYFGKVQSIEVDLHELGTGLNAVVTNSRAEYAALQNNINSNALAISKMQGDFANFLSMRQENEEQQALIDTNLREKTAAVNRRIDRIEGVIEALRTLNSRLERIEDAVRPETGRKR